MPNCPQCGAELGSSDPAGLCPRCLIQGAFDSSVGADQSSAQTTDAATVAAVDDFGRYHILRSLGEGGMGTVYLAEQREPIRRLVALKVVKLGMDTNEVLARFAKERQALAVMDHPNIARIFDAGATSKGRPYFVMEYIEGAPITRFCDGKRMTIGQRLELFLAVCRAVHHAHQKGVIHRDLKPSNVLVMEQDRAPVPKVIDFGIAKATDQRTVENTLLTQFGQMVGTPEYASPEQADVMTGDVDESSDVYSLGVILYELLVGTVPFDAARIRQAGLVEMLRIMREEEAPPLSRKLTATGPAAADIAAHRQTDAASLRRLVNGDLNSIALKALDKVRGRRYPSVAGLAADVQRHIEHRPVLASPPSRLYRARKFLRRNRLAVLGVAGGFAALLLLAMAGYEWFHARRSPPPVVSQRDWVPLTDFADSAVSPALSPDGHILTFIRGGETFCGKGEIYAKLLPNGEPVQLTHDSVMKMSPQFSPDGSNIAYTAVDLSRAQDNWNTWVIPALGGESRLMLPNAEGLTWIGGGHLLFSEIKTGLHMALVTATETRDQSRDVYLPPSERGMAHRSAISPDHKWVLVSEMDNGGWLPCRLVPFDGSTAGKPIGPPDAGCTYVGWSPDQKWMYVSSDAGGRFHIWRQSFPDGEPQQVTSGATEEEGIAVAPDGRSLVTSVGLRQSTLWVRDGKGERQVSSEGYAAYPQFSPDGKKLYYLVRRESVSGQLIDFLVSGELWVANLETGQGEHLLPNFLITGYSISHDGMEIVFSAKEKKNRTHLWLASVDFRFPPRQFSSPANEDQPHWDASGHIYFRAAEGKSNFLYRMNADGSERVKMLPDPILEFEDVSPDGRWALVARTFGQEAPLFASSLDGGGSVTICPGLCFAQWTSDGGTFSVMVARPSGGVETLVVPVSPSKSLPPLPSAGLQTRTDMERVRGAKILNGFVTPGPKPGISASLHRDVHRNLYSVSLQ
jgi:eukaryotic-like serine/threonine-protein kinase